MRQKDESGGFDRVDEQKEAIEMEKERQRQMEQKQKHEFYRSLAYERLRGAGLSIGMSKDAVLSNPLWHYPDDVDTTITPNGKLELLSYHAVTMSDSVTVYLKFQNGVLTTIHLPK